MLICIFFLYADVTNYKYDSECNRMIDLFVFIVLIDI